MSNPFKNRNPLGNPKHRLRTPQKEAYGELKAFARTTSAEREVGIILPVGCGKSGCITITPYAFQSKRALVVAPGTQIAGQLLADFDATSPDNFYLKAEVFPEPPYPELVEIRGTTTNKADLDEAHVVVTNIQQLQGAQNRWLAKLPSDFFDLILFDEGHHNVAGSWELLRTKFPSAKIVNFSATPLRADGQLMTGRILYSYPIARAITEGYVKRLKAVVLNPRTLRYVRRTDGAEVVVDLEEVKRLGEEDANFRRSIVTSTQSLNTIVDASIRELQKLRKVTGEPRLKIIASALNFEHCRQVVEAYRGRGLRADYVHSREDADANKKVMKKLEQHDLDVIVQVRKLGEGFDHRHLAVAAVFSVFSNLSPFVQFVGRIMRVIKQDAPGHVLNQGVVVFHAGANIAKRWQDFQSYSEADQQFFDQLLPLEELAFNGSEEIEIDPLAPVVPREPNPIDVKGQTDVRLEEIQLIQNDDQALAALKLLRERGYSSDQVRTAFEALTPVPTSKVKQRQAKRQSLNMRVKTEAARILSQRKIPAEGKQLDKKRLGRSNLVVLMAAISKQVSAECGGKKPVEFSRTELDQIDDKFPELVARAVKKVIDE